MYDFVGHVSANSARSAGPGACASDVGALRHADTRQLFKQTWFAQFTPAYRAKYFVPIAFLIGLFVVQVEPARADRCVHLDCRTICHPVSGGGRWWQDKCRMKCWREPQRTYVDRPTPVSRCDAGFYHVGGNRCCQNGSLYDAAAGTCVWPQQEPTPLSDEAKRFWIIVAFVAFVVWGSMYSGGYRRNRRDIASFERQTERALSSEEMLAGISSRMQNDAAEADAVIKRMRAEAYAAGRREGAAR